MLKKMVTSGRTTKVMVAAIACILMDGLLPISLLSSISLNELSSNQTLAQTSRPVNPQADTNKTSEQIYQDAHTAVVRIETPDRLGTGSIIDQNGLILTNAHVVADIRIGGEVQVTTADGQQFSARVLGFAPDGVDLAILQIPDVTGLPTISIAKTGTEINPGQDAHIIGNPLGERWLMNSGRVSGLEGGRIYLDLNGNPGNSGGPVLNNHGELIAVYTGAILARGGAGLPFGISSRVVDWFLETTSEIGVSRVPTIPLPQRVALNSPPLVDTLNRNSDRTNDGRFFNEFVFQGRAGQKIVIEMSSNQINPCLHVLSPDGQLLDHRDSTEGRSQIELELPSDGIYTIFTDTRNVGETGTYQLRVTEARFRAPHDESLVLRELGILKVDSPRLKEDNSRYQQHSFQAEAGDTVTIQMESDDFDTRLMLLDANGRLIAANDDRSSTTYNSEIQVTLEQAGTYVIFANAYNSVEQGLYTLTVRKMN